MASPESPRTKLTKEVLPPQKPQNGISVMLVAAAAMFFAVASSTLILITWDEGGGFFDHVPPPPSVDVDDQGNPVPYGTRVPLLVLGPFVKPGTISHVTMEHSSIVRFLEYNFLGPVGQLGYNDAKVHNIGSLLDQSTTGVHVPP